MRGYGATDRKDFRLLDRGYRKIRSGCNTHGPNVHKGVAKARKKTARQEGRSACDGE